MKYRIIEKRYSNGSSRFYPQARRWMFWHNFTRCMGIDTWADVYCDSMEDAVRVIGDAKRNDVPAVEVARIIYQEQ